jgi:hypothetical protein
MYIASRIALIGSGIARFSGMAGFVLLLAANSSAQAQQQGSLADTARQMRAQKSNQPGTEAIRAQEVADELSDNQNDSAPGGFKTYNAVWYKLWVPAPYTTNSDSGGTVLSGPRVGSTMPLVLVGSTLVLQPATSDEAFRDAATKFDSGYGGTVNCSKTSLANHDALQCGLAGAKLLGHSVSGTAMFIRGSGQIFPVFCVANSDSQARDTLNDPASSYSQKMWARRTLAQEDEYVREVWQKCNSVFQSIHFTESAAQPETTPLMGAGAEAPKPAATPKAPPQAATAANAGTTGANSPAVAPAESSVPTGFKVHPFTYCRSQRDCWNASIVVPADAQLVSSDCKQYVFEVKVQGSPLLLLAGPAAGEGCGNRSSSDPSQVRWNELAAPENRRAPGTSNTISSQQTKLGGKPAIITQIGFRKGMTEWMGKRAEIESNGVPLVVGCIAQREHFGDGETICSSLIESLQLP